MRTINSTSTPKQDALSLFKEVKQGEIPSLYYLLQSTDAGKVLTTDEIFSKWNESRLNMVAMLTSAVIITIVFLGVIFSNNQYLIENILKYIGGVIGLSIVGLLLLLSVLYKILKPCFKIELERLISNARKTNKESFLAIYHSQLKKYLQQRRHTGGSQLSTSELALFGWRLAELPEDELQAIYKDECRIFWLLMERKYYYEYSSEPYIAWEAKEHVVEFVNAWKSKELVIASLGDNYFNTYELMKKRVAKYEQKIANAKNDANQILEQFDTSL